MKKKTSFISEMQSGGTKYDNKPKTYSGKEQATTQTKVVDTTHFNRLTKSTPNKTEKMTKQIKQHVKKFFK